MAKNKELPTPSNGWVGDKIGYSPSGASLLRRGQRQPTLHTMRAVDLAVGWPMEQQVRADNRSEWHDRFERKMRETYAREINTTKEK